MITFLVKALNFDSNGLMYCQADDYLRSNFKAILRSSRAFEGHNKKGLELTAKITQDLTHTKKFSKKFSRGSSYSPDKNDQSTKGDGR